MNANENNQDKQNRAQPDRFIETARALGCDEDKERFEETLGGVAARKTEKPVLKKPRRRPKASRKDAS
jgi:hypothetical protein